MSIREFSVLVEKVKVVENLKSSSKVAKPQMVGGPNPQLPPNVKYFRCGRLHMIRFCPHPAPNVICGRCHKYGHVAKDCHTKLEVPNVNGGQQVQQGNNQKPRAIGRVFAISGAEAPQSTSLVRGICFILDMQLSVLFDSGATHSFIFVNCVKKLKLPIRELDVELVVSTPT